MFKKYHTVINANSVAFFHLFSGYVPSASTYSPPRHTRPSRVTSSSTSRSLSTPPPRNNTSIGANIAFTQRHPSPLRSLSPSRITTTTVLPGSDTASYLSPRFDIESFSSSSYHSPRPTSTLTHVHSTPPTKDYSSTSKYASPSSGARR